jgi:D-inositol-3-phosphate glycosyltransferase
MNIGLFWDYLEPIINTDERMFYDGAKISSAEFVRSLIDFSSAEISVFTFPSHGEVSRIAINNLKEKNNAFEKVKVYNLAELKDNINNLTAIHEHTQTRINTINNTRARYASKNIPFTFVPHGMGYQNSLDLCLTALMSGSLKSYDAVICPSRQAKINFETFFDYVSREIKEKSGIEKNLKINYKEIPLGVSTDNFKPRDKKELRKRFNLPLDKKILIYAGRVSPYTKADLFPFLIAFRNYLGTTVNKPLLLIVGSDREFNYSATLHEFINGIGLQDSVKLVDKLPREQLPLYYSLSDIFVSPYDNCGETFSLTITEALASGLPVVISDWNGHKDLIEHGIHGFKASTYWLEQDDTLIDLTYEHFPRMAHFYTGQLTSVNMEEFFSYIHQILNNETLSDNMSLKARKRALDLYSWKVVIKKYEELWAELAEKANTDYQGNSTFLAAEIFQRFNSCPSRVLNPSDKIIITPSGMSLIGKDYNLTYYLEIKKFIEKELVYKICNLCIQNISIQEIRDKLQTDNLSGLTVNNHIMWALKYGLIKLVKNEENSPPGPLFSSFKAGKEGEEEKY